MIWLSAFLYLRDRLMSYFYINKLDKNINLELVIIHKNKHDSILKIIKLNNYIWY